MSNFTPEEWRTLLALVSLVGAGAVGGMFFAFSSFVMPALARLPRAEGIAAMQSINVTVLRPSFLGVFIGTALLSVVAIVLALRAPEAAGSMELLAAGLSYVVAVFLVTGMRNVPMNEALARIDTTKAEEAEAGEYWEHYLRRWTRWNSVRTGASLAASLLFALAALAG